MLEAIRLKTFLSSTIENRISNFEISWEEKIELFNIIKNYYKDEESALLFIPKNIRTILEMNPLLKIECEKLRRNRNSKIQFCDIQSEKKCVTFIEKVANTEKLIISEIQKKAIPFIINESDEEFKKDCEIDCENLFCSSVKAIPYTNIKNKNFNIVSGCNIKQWVFIKNEITNDTIKNFLKVVAKFFNLSLEDLKKLNKINFSNDFIKDIEKESSIEIREILIAVARSIYFEPRGANGREYSIDYHRNSDLHSYGNYQLFRLDCVPLERTGLSNSGKRRVLFGVKNDIRYYISYTSDHDFSKIKIKNILDNL